jgi:hypothetical protein
MMMIFSDCFSIVDIFLSHLGISTFAQPLGNFDLIMIRIVSAVFLQVIG